MRNPKDAHHLRTQPYMPFGSMMNAFAVINSGRRMGTKSFIKNAKLIFEASVEIVEDRYDEVQKGIAPITDEGNTTPGKVIAKESKF